MYSKIKSSRLILITTFAIVFFIGAGVRNVSALTLTPIRFELTGDPGQTIVEKVTLINETKNPQTFYPSFSNFEAQGEDGNPTFVDPVDGLSTWMNVTETSITLQPAQSTIVPLIIKIPDNAAPGGYFSALFFGTIPPNDTSSQVAIGAKTGVLVLLSVNGDIQKSASVMSFDTKKSQRFYTALPVEMSYKFQNTGGDRVKPKGQIVIKNIFGIKATTLDANPINGNVLPKQIRKFDVVWQKHDAPLSEKEVPESMNFFQSADYERHNFALGYFTANLNLSDVDGSNGVATAQTKFFVFPWQLLVVIFILLISLLIILKFLIRHYNRWIIGQAEIALERAQAKKESMKETS